VVPAATLSELVEGLDRQGVFGQCDAIMTGYLGDPATGPVALDAVGRVRRERPDAVYLCDPVIGDHGQRYVRDGLETFFCDVAVPAADIVTPNPFEAELLTGRAVASVEDALRACDALRAIRLGTGRSACVLSTRTRRLAPITSPHCVNQNIHLAR